jgi:hypothetical protein
LAVVRLLYGAAVDVLPTPRIGFALPMRRLVNRAGKQPLHKPPCELR